ncbi:hypothetical protein ABZ578_33975, partial [Streptomyces sp. NPDC013489]
MCAGCRVGGGGRVGAGLGTGADAQPLQQVSGTDPAPVGCAVCGTPMPPLLTVDKWECDGGSR